MNITKSEARAPPGHPENPYRDDTPLGFFWNLSNALVRWVAQQRRDFKPPSDSKAPAISGSDDDDALVEQMQQMRSDKTASSRWKAADTMAGEAKGRSPTTKVESKRDRLIKKHEAKYPGVW